MKYQAYQKTIVGSLLVILSFASFAQAPSMYPPQFNPSMMQNPYTMPGAVPPTMPPRAPQAYGYSAPYYQQMPVPQGYAPSNNQRVQQAPIGAQKPFREFSGYLGIAVDILPASLIAQLPEGATQGILVKEFAKDSPASRDLKPFDVIVKYGDTPLKHPAQFIKLVREDEPSKKVLLKVVRKGDVIEVNVTIGAQKTPNPKDFNGLAIKQLGKNKYEALIRFVGNNGNKQRRSYRGTREEIFEQAINAQDLPQAERQQLLYATRPRQGGSNKGGFGSFFPFGGKNESGKDWMNPSRFFKW